MPLCRFGDAYWLVDLEVDCSSTPGGWFDVRGWLAGDAGVYSGLEDPIHQGTCKGERVTLRILSRRFASG